MYTVQRNANNDLIVCAGSKTEKGYFVVFKGSFYQCNQLAKGFDI